MGFWVRMEWALAGFRPQSSLCRGSSLPSVQEEPIVLMWSPGSLQTLKDCIFFPVGVANAATKDVVGHGHERCRAHCYALRHSLVR